MHHSTMFHKRLKRYLAIAIVAILAVTAVVIWEKAGTTTATHYKTEQVRRGELTVIVTATGTLQPTNTVSVGSELSGITKSVEVDYNDRVKIGQVLARLDTSKLEAQITQSKAAMESARAKVLQTKATVAEMQAKLSQFQKVRELSNGKVPRSQRWMLQKRLWKGQGQMPPVLLRLSPRLKPLYRLMRQTFTNRSSGLLPGFWVRGQNRGTRKYKKPVFMRSYEEVVVHCLHYT